MNIEIGKTYNVFDDGKIKESRMYQVKVTEVIPFDKIDEDTLEQWKQEVEDCDHLYAKQTDFFIKSWNGADVETFVRTTDGGWFSMGFMCCGRLDIDGYLLNKITI